MQLAWLYRYSIRNPRRVVVTAVLLTLAIAPGAGRLKLRTDGHALVPGDAPEVLYDESIREKFDNQDPIVVLIKSDDAHGIFNVHTLRLVEDLTTAFQQVDGVRPSNVLSLATEGGDRVIPGTLRFRRFLEPFPTTREELDRLRRDLQAIELYTGTLVSYDEQATAIFFGVPAGTDRTGIYRRIQEIIRSIAKAACRWSGSDGRQLHTATQEEAGDTPEPPVRRSELPEEIHVIGAPVAEALLGTHILEDLGVPSALMGHRLGRDDRGQTAPWPGSLYELRLLIGRHIGLVPIAIAVMAIVFLVSFRSLTATLLPLSEVAACLIVVFGLMGWFDVPVYLTIAVLPVILTAVGVADEIHIFSRYAQCLREKPEQDHVDAVTTTMAEMCSPVVKTSVTTSVGFLSFALSPIGPVRAFGVFTSVGIIFCMLWSLTVIPALLVLTRPRGLVAGRRKDADGEPDARAPVFERLGAGVLRWRYVALVIGIILTATTPLGLRQIAVQDSWIDGFAPDSEFYRTTQTFNQQFLGTHILLVCVDTGSEVLTGELEAGDLGHHHVSLPGDLVSDPEALVGQYIRIRRPGSPAVEDLPSPRRRGRTAWNSRIETAIRQGEHIVATVPRRAAPPKLTLGLRDDDAVVQYELEFRRLTWPETLKRIAGLEEFIESLRQYTVGGVIGPAAYVKTTNFMTRARAEKHRRIPDDSLRVQQVWSRYVLARGEERLRQVVDEDYAQALVTVYMTNANFMDTARLMEAICDYEREHLAPHSISLQFAGDVAVSQTLIDAIVTTQTRSLLISLVGILAVTAALGRSVKWGVYCVLPCALAVLVNFAVMGMIGMPLGVATSMFAGMTLGIGVDYAIHLMERYRLARLRGAALEAALLDAVTVTGPAVVIDALAVGLGFGIMTLSQVPANARLGGLVVLSIAGCLVATLLLLPALIRLWPPRVLTQPVGHQDPPEPPAV